MSKKGQLYALDEQTEHALAAIKEDKAGESMTSAFRSSPFSYFGNFSFKKYYQSFFLDTAI